MLLINLVITTITVILAKSHVPHDHPTFGDVLRYKKDNQIIKLADKKHRMGRQIRGMSLHEQAERARQRRAEMAHETIQDDSHMEVEAPEGSHRVTVTKTMAAIYDH